MIGTWAKREVGLNASMLLRLEEYLQIEMRE